MKRSLIVASLVVALGLLAGAAIAQRMGPGMMEPGPMMGPGGSGMMGMMGCPMMGRDSATASFAEGRIAFLKAELAITDAQKDAWEAYAAALKRNLESMQGMGQAMHAMADAKTPVERLDARIGMMDTRLAALKELKPALQGLYGALSAEQKKKADEVLTGMGCMM